jgi:hypothetical protein
LGVRARGHGGVPFTGVSGCGYGVGGTGGCVSYLTNALSEQKAAKLVVGWLGWPAGQEISRKLEMTIYADRRCSCGTGRPHRASPTKWTQAKSGADNNRDQDWSRPDPDAVLGRTGSPAAMSLRDREGSALRSDQVPARRDDWEYAANRCCGIDPYPLTDPAVNPATIWRSATR